MKLRLCFILLIWCTATLAFAQKLTLNTTNISSIDGLSQNSVQCIYKDHFGFMWFGTQDGLNKYDGVDFTIYKHANSNAKSLSANLVKALNEDADGNLWVGTRLGGLSRYNRAADAFVNFKNNPAVATSLSDNTVNVIYTDHEANLWIGTSNGLNLYVKKTHTFRHFFNVPGNASSLSNSAVYSIAEDAQHQLWVGTAAGLNLMDKHTGKCLRYMDKNNRKNGDNNAIYGIINDEQNEIWVGTGTGVSLLDKVRHTFTYYAIDQDKNIGGGINFIFSLIKTGGNKFWIGSNTTVQLFDAGNRRLLPISEHTNGEGIMPNDGIYSVYEDNAGILWMGTINAGVLKYDRNVTIFPAYGASMANIPAAKNVVHGIAEDRKGNLYMATDVGLQYLNRAAGTYTTYQHNARTGNSLMNNYTLALLTSKKTDALWIGTYSSGLDRLDTRTGVFTHFKKGEGEQELRGNAIYGLFEDSKGDIWIGADGGGLQIYHPQTHTFTRYMHQDGNSNTVCDNGIQVITEDREGNMWLGGYSNGISVFNPATGKFKQLNTDNSKLTSNVISSFYEDAKGNMWVGTMEGGLNCYNKHENRFVALSDKSGSIDNTINYISGDAAGNLWLSTNKGIICYNPATRNIKNYGYYNGIKSLEFNLCSGVKLSTGEIAFGNSNGINVVDPNKILVDRNQSPVVITGFELFNKPVALNTEDSPLKQSILTTKEIYLKHNQSVFSIDYAALDYSIPTDNKYAYKLEGFDKDWRYVGNQREATYTNLDPGTYTFRVKAANEDHVWGEKETQLVIHVVPPYWLTWWFRLLCAAAIIGIYYVFYLYKISFIKKQKVELQKQVEVRTLEIGEQASSLKVLNRELELQKEELQAQSKDLYIQSRKLTTLNLQLTEQKTQEQNARLIAEKAMLEAHKSSLAKSTFLATMSHEIRTPMNGVLGMASLLAETRQDKEQREYTEAIINSGEALLLVINDILDFSKIESGNLDLDYHSFNLGKCIEDVMALFSFRAAEASIQLIHHTDNSVPAYVTTDSLRLRQVLTNLIGNAMKFTHKGVVSILVSARQEPEGNLTLHFEITDTGIGIPEEQVGNLFQAFNQVDSSITRRYGGSGLGLAICKRLVGLMGGDITVKSEVGVGSTFAFSVLCQKDAQTSLFIADDPSAFNDKRALVISDGADARNIKAQLNEWGIGVTLIASGQTAVKALEEHKDYNVIIADVKPDSEGIAKLSYSLQLLPGRIPYILFRDENDKTDATHLHQFTSVLAKPFEAKQLHDVLAFHFNAKAAKEGGKKPLLTEEFAVVHPMHILVAEDNLINQKLIMRTLTKLGYQPDLANDGQEVLNLMSAKTYHLVLMDVQMPNMDGIEATRLIRQIYGSRPLIAAMTANAMSEDKEKCLHAGMDDYLAKPVKIEVLTEKLTALFKML